MSHPLSRSGVATLADLLRATAQAAPDQVIVHSAAAGHERPTSYRELYAAARRVALSLHASGLAPGQVLLVSLESGDFLAGFWGALLAGIVPAPLAAEPERILAIWAALDQPALLVSAAVGEELLSHGHPQALAMAQQRAVEGPWAAPGVRLFSPSGADARPQPADLAYLQFSSGSTGDPRGVELSHAALLANLGQMLAGCAISTTDSAVSWMPYYHDMGLIAGHLLPLAAGIKQVKLDEFYFARRPAAWLEAAHRHRATLLSAAPFALGLVSRRVAPERIAGLDLTNVRMLAVGAEPIDPATCRAFLDRLAPAGLSPQALLPVYGLAEACVGVTMSPLGTGMATCVLDRQSLAREDRAVMETTATDAGRLLEVVDVGAPLPDCRVRIVDDRDRPLEDGAIGHIQVAGPQLMRGYHRSADPAAPFCDGWLRTGDLGFLRAGRLAITGRAKEVVIVNGHKHHAPDLEDAVSKTEGLHARRLAVCGAVRPGSSEERVVVFLALRPAGTGGASPWQRALPALGEVMRRLRRATGTAAIDIVPLPAREFPRTTSGKLRRTHLRARYEAGEFAGLVSAVHAALAAASPPAAAQAADALEHEVIGLCAQALGVDARLIGAHDSVFDLGATSLQLMDLLASIGDRFGIEADPAALRARPTPAGLADWLRLQNVLISTELDKQSTSGNRAASTEPVAIIGMACRLPGADTPEQFWANLVAGADSVRPLPARRGDGTAGPAPTGPAWGSLLDDVGSFDAAFFAIDPGEAAAMDPQQRILLELAYQALERAGYAAGRRAGRRAGVFIGVGESSYQQLLLPLLEGGEAIHPSTATGTMRNLIAGRIAHCLDLSGPAIAIDTACSSTLVALHLARTSLLLGDCDLALVGGINLNLTETPFQLLERAGALSPSGRCRAFDDGADGIVLGEGAGILILERLELAERNGDQVLALIRGSSINNDGRALSPMAPNPLRQAEALRQAYREAGIDPASVSYIEAHGTGTAIGDPTEARSLAQVFPAPADAAPRLIGSVKTNVGHLLNAAGVPALIKVLLMLQHRQIPPSLHYRSPNHRFDLERAGMAVSATLRPWAGPQPLRAGVNSFGFGGTNAHVILEEPPAPLALAEAARQATAAPPFHLLAFSARTGRVLRELAAGLAERLRADPALGPADVGFSLAEREVFEHRAALVAGGPSEPGAATTEELASALEGLAAGRGDPALLTAPPAARRRKVALLFAGQGAQYPGQGAALYRAEAAFRATLDAASQQLGPINGRTLVQWCLDDAVTTAQLADTAVTQPLLVAFEVALARLAIGWGIAPDAVVGHSVGELAAACIAGALAFEDALELARARGRLMAACAEPGMMAAVFAPAAAVRAVVDQAPEELAIAAFNTPNQVVISGRRAAVERALETLERDGFSAVVVNHSLAYHSPLVQPAVRPIAAAAAALRPAAPAIPLLSTVSVEWVGGPAALDAGYWAAQVARPVRFAPAIERLIDEGFDTFVEIGPGSTLTAFARQILAGRDSGHVAEALLRRGADDGAIIRAAAGRLWVAGVNLDLRAVAAGQPGRRVPLPAYPFARDRHWLPAAPSPAPPLSALALRVAADRAPLLDGRPIAAVALRPTPGGYSLALKAADGQTLLELADLRADAPEPAPASTQALLHQVAWVAADLPEPAADPIRRWVIIADQGGEIAGRLNAALRAADQHCVVATSESLYTVLGTISAQRYGVIILADCGPDSAIDQVADLEQAQRAGVLRLLEDVQCLLGRPVAERPAGLWVATAGAHAHGDEEIAAHRAASAGLAAALPDQHAGFPCLAIDLPAGEDSDALANTLLRELGAEPVSGVFAWRAGRRRIRSLAPLAPAEAGADGEARSQPEAMAGRVVIIAGGAGGVGAHLVRHLAARHRPQLILLGRSALDPRRAALLAELEALGSPARYCQIDICDERQVEQLVAGLAASAEDIFGVVQAAGDIDVASLQAKSAGQFAAVLAPKVSGTWLLARALARHGQRPAFFVTCSSIASVLPGLGGGIADYVAANAFLDAFAASERRAGRPMTALNWPAWDGVGWAAIPALLDRLRQRGLTPLNPAMAGQAFDQALRAGASQIVVLAPPQPAAAEATPQAPRLAGAVAPAFAPENPSGVAGQLQALVGRALRIAPEAVPLDTSFLALGLDSLQAVDLVKQLEQSTGAVLPLTLFFEFQTIRELARHLSGVVPREAGAAEVAGRDAEPAAPAASFPLAPAQVAFYIGHRLNPAGPAFSLVRQEIAGPLDPAALRHALTCLLERHPMLRAQFEPLAQEQAEPRQRILAPEMLPPALWWEQREAPDDLDALERALAHHQFDLGRAPLFRVVLCRRADGRWALFMLLHHGIADGWSTSILLDELWQIYTRHVQGLPMDLPPLACTFAEYASLARAAADSPRADQDRAWWAAVFRQRSAALDWRLPGDGPDAESTSSILSVRRRLDAAASQRLRRHAAELGVSLFHLLLAAYARQLAGWTQAAAIAINVAENGRGIRLPGVERLVGCCADHLPLLMPIDDAETSGALALRVRDEWAAIQQHGAVSALDLARLCGAGRRAGPRTPGSASFSLARFPGALPDGCPITIEELAAGTATSATRLSLLIWEVDGALHCAWMYATAAFQPQTIERLADGYQQELALLAQTDARPDQPAGDAARLPGDAMETEILAPARIFDQCLRWPERIAVRADGRSLTYGALAGAAGAVARWIQASGAGPSQPVGLLAQPGIASIVGIVGALWAGAPWLGLNADYPLIQLQDQLDQAGARHLLYHDDTDQLARQARSGAKDDLRLLNLDAVLRSMPPVPASRAAEPAPGDLAHIMFTSGSTGRPKGVPITQRALANYLQWLVETFEYGPDDRLLQTAALSFDAAVSQILGPLISGGTVVALSPLVVRDPAELLAAVERERPTIWRSVPSLWERLLSAIERRVAAGQEPPALAELRVIGVGGEALPASYVRRWRDIYGDRQLIANHYGPTEATINATCYSVPRLPAGAAHIPIGRPIRAAVARVLDEQGRPCPAGTTGELHIGGVCLSPGYLGRPDLTAAQFVPDPLRPGERLYRTGDLVRELADGNLVFVGRADDQIKLRGYRIEPAEIEAALLEHEAVARAAVCLVDGAGQPPMLAAYLEANAALPPDAALRRWLAALLPPQMIPQRFHVLPALPTTASGKIDRARLGALRLPAPADLPHGEPPKTPTEELLAEVWREVLRLPSVSRDDDFFELGGDSLLLLHVLTRLEGRVPVLPRAAAFYQHSTLAAFARALDAAARSVPGGIAAPGHRQPEAAGPPGFPLTPAQAGFVLAETIDPAAATTWCARLAVAGPLDQTLLRRALGALTRRHLMLRVRILINERPPRQQEDPSERPPELGFDDLMPQIADGAEETLLVEEFWRAEQARRLQLDQLPLLRMRVLRLGPTRHVWLIAAHHIIGDGWSAWIFGQELLRIYDCLSRGQSPDLPDLRSTFFDYVNNLQHDRARVTPLHERYWRTTFAQPYRRPLLQRGADWTPGQSAAPSSVSRALSPDALAHLRRAAAEAGLTPYVLLLTLFVHQLRRLSGADDLVIGTAHSGRDLALPDIERIFGCFATALPIRFSHSAPDRAASARSLLPHVAEAFRAAYRHALPPSEIARAIGTGGGATLAAATGAQFFFTFLDFDSLGPLSSETLAIDWDVSHTEVQPPHGANELLFAARSANGALRLTLQGAALDQATLHSFIDDLIAELASLTAPSEPTRGTAGSTIRFGNGPSLLPARLDAALIGYLPPSRSLAAVVGLQGDEATIRARLRGLLFPDGQPRWLEALETPIGRSALLCLPWFAEELRPEVAGRLGAEIAAGMVLAQARGARCASLAGMLPSLTGYGFGVLRALEGDRQARPALTTGHATTVVAVAQTVEAALRATGRELAASAMALVGLGSIGQAVLGLLLRTLPHPQSLVLCDTAGHMQRLGELAQTLRTEAGYRGSIEIVAADHEVPAAVYRAGVIVAAASTAGIIAVERLQAGTIVVDDSFPPCLDTGAAIGRMRRSGDVLIVGGGQLACGPSQRTIDLPLNDPALRERILAEILPGAAASCQLEGLLWAADPTLPLTRGLVGITAALRYREAAIAAGFGPAPLHLQSFQPDARMLAMWRSLRKE